MFLRLHRTFLHFCQFLAICYFVSPVAIAQNTRPRVRSAAKSTGVVVIKVDRDSEGEVAGVKVRDRVAGWALGTTHGRIESPFDWTELLVEQAPRGTLTLQGWRAGQRMTWDLGLRAWV